MNVRSCEYLIAIGEHETLSLAAKSLGVSQPTLSAFLTGTEQQMGHLLFQRRNKLMVPTEAGRIYLDACRRIVETKKRTYHSIHALSNQQIEQFTVGATPHRGSTLFARMYSGFTRRYPEVSVKLREGYISALFDMLDTGEVDLVIGGVSPDIVDHYGASIHNQEHLLLCVPDFHPLAALAAPPGAELASIDIRRFQDTPFVMWGEQTANSRTVRNLFREAGFSPTVVYKSNNAMFIDSMLANGLGVGFLPESYCVPMQNRVYFTTDPPLLMSTGILFRKGMILSEAQRYFIYLSIRDHLIGTTTTVDMNRLAQEIYGEFREDNDGYTAN